MVQSPEVTQDCEVSLNKMNKRPLFPFTRTRVLSMQRLTIYILSTMHAPKPLFLLQYCAYFLISSSNGFSLQPLTTNSHNINFHSAINSRQNHHTHHTFIHKQHRVQQSSLLYSTLSATILSDKNDAREDTALSYIIQWR